MRNSPALALFAALTMLCFSGCGAIFKSKQLAEQKVADLHLLYNDGKHREIYDTAHAKLKKATTERAFRARLEAMQSALGKVTGTTLTGMNLNSQNLVTTIELTENTTFEKGSGTETFTFQLEGKDVVLIDYTISSKGLTVK